MLIRPSTIFCIPSDIIYDLPNKQTNDQTTIQRRNRTWEEKKRKQTRKPDTYKDIEGKPQTEILFLVFRKDHFSSSPHIFPCYA